jgi:hypothetical protein
LSAHLDAVDAGQSDVKDDDVRIDLTCQRECTSSVVGEVDFEQLTLEVARNDAGQWGFVVDYQRSEVRGHGRCCVLHGSIVPPDRNAV